MRMPAIVFGLLFSLLAVAGAEARVYKSPQALIKSLYADTIDPAEDDAPSPYSAYFSDALNESLTANGEAVDFDPILAGQDGVASNIQLSPPIVFDNTAELEVSFRNGKRSATLFYTLVRENGGWKVDDIADQSGDEPWSLRDLLGQ
ncbi:YbjP/YqhG family protein [Neorhizobium galegae]|uniref:YbjP/YqhG family protein n=1 Tax=Neorhizobium galegae TaxID=399 RepID=UPI001F3AA06E|nr:YbjP/YqhG family protein [Neorhizobium galegae]UIK07255.1 YbjP/YqhG family protein [Neorhizobium galegae]